jgi:ferredoxin-NADP reductase
MGGMMEGMGEMMKGMGAPPPKELYPTLMDLPELSPERRAEVVRLARERMETGKAQMFAAMERMSAAAARDDYAAMQEATRQSREAVAIFESGLAAHRALSEGKAPRNVALRWFKREMNLASPVPEEPRTLLGVKPFHLFTMVLLIAFALAMVAMYFFKMRRAAALFGRLGPDTNRPPPGASPPLAGAPGPSAPVVPPPGGTSASAAPTSPATPPAVSDATSASPVTANWRGQLRVGSIVTETPSVKTFRLLSSSHDRFLPFTFVPGQFLNVTFWVGGARMNRSYSISSSPTQREYVELTVKREPRGAVSRHIDDLLKVGDQIEAGGPVGKFTFTGTEADSIVLISGGVGITPMMSIIRYLTERSWAGDIFFIYACRAPTDFIFANEVAALQSVNPKLRVAVTMECPEGTDWKGPRGRISKELLTEMVPDLASRRIHLCGPLPMMDSTKAILTELGVLPDQVKTELFGAAKPTPAAAGTTAKRTAPATGPMVTFSKNNKSAKIHVDQTVLELSEELAIGIEFSCRIGTCGVCKVRMTYGEVEMAVEDALDPDDKANGIILACQAKAKIDIAVEA